MNSSPSLFDDPVSLAGPHRATGRLAGKIGPAPTNGTPTSDLAAGKQTLPAQSHSETSVAAAESMVSKAAVSRRKVLEALKREGDEGLTDQEIEWAADLSGNCARPRRIELVNDGLVRDSGRTRKTSSGRQAVVWVATGDANANS